MGVTPPGVAQVIFGRPGTQSVQLDALGSSEGLTVSVPHAVTSVDLGPSVNRDDVPDLIIGAPDPFGGGGEAFVVYGGKGGKLDGRNLGDRGYLMESNDRTGCKTGPARPLCGDDFGQTVAGVDDVNGDGRGDVIVGAPGTSVGNPSGAAYLLFGRDPSPPLRVKRKLGVDGFAILPGSLSFQKPALDVPGVGASVAGLGDLDGDRRGEVAIGVPGAQGAFVVSSKPNKQGP